MVAIPGPDPTFILQVGSNGQLTVSQLSGGDLSSAILSQLLSVQRDIPAVTKLFEAMIIRNLT